MDTGIIELVRITLQYAVAPVAIIMWWSYKKFDNRLSIVETRLNLTERANDVLDTKINDIRKDLAHIQQGIDILLSERRNK